MKFPLWGSGQKKLDVNAAYANEMAPFLTPGATYTRWNENTKRMEPVDVDAIGRQKMADLQRVRASQDSFDKKMKFFQGADQRRCRARSRGWCVAKHIVNSRRITNTNWRQDGILAR